MVPLRQSPQLAFQPPAEKVPAGQVTQMPPCKRGAFKPSPPLQAAELDRGGAVGAGPHSLCELYWVGCRSWAPHMCEH